MISLASGRSRSSCLRTTVATLALRGNSCCAFTSLTSSRPCSQFTITTLTLRFRCTSISLTNRMPCSKWLRGRTVTTCTLPSLSCYTFTSRTNGKSRSYCLDDTVTSLTLKCFRWTSISRTNYRSCSKWFRGGTITTLTLRINIGAIPTLTHRSLRGALTPLTFFRVCCAELVLAVSRFRRSWI